MLIDHLSESFAGSKPYTTLTELLVRGSDATVAAPGLVRPALVATTFRARPRPTLVVLAGEEVAERFWRQTAALLGRELVLRLPDRTDLPWTEDAPDLEQVGARCRALHALDKSRPVIVVASARALLRAVPPHGSRAFDPLVLAPGATLDLEESVTLLTRMGYERLDLAEEPGQFAVRGGILDVFPVGATAPVRAELFGDEIETLLRYVPSTGQAIGSAETIEVYPCRELAIASRGAETAAKALRERALKDTKIAHQLELIDQGVYFNGIERFLPLFYKRVGGATDYLGADSLVVVAEPRSLFDDTVRRREELETAASTMNYRSMMTGKAALDGLYLKPADLDFGEHQRFTIVSLHRAGTGIDAEFNARRPEVAGGEEKFIGGVKSLISTGYKVALAVPDRRARQRIGDLMLDAGVTVSLTETEVPAGFVVPSAHFAVVSIDDVYPRSSQRRARRQIDPTRMTFAFNPGDYVVHATHGIALFREIVRQEVLGQERDYLLLEYSRGDKLYVPVEQIDRITKYVGAEGSSPRVTRLNTADWSKATGKARKAARKLAFDLVDLYARRSTVQGFAYREDTPWQMEMEASFPVKVEVLSRFRSDEQQKVALEGFADGDVDILVGTHRLLSRDVAPKNLGLVIIDEEQRFGVEHKEHMKNLREQVDVLTLSATPIPRTLQMSLSGVRDMSVIDTPPPNRFPVHVHVGEWDEDVVSGAIRRELERGGQVYYVSNRVKTIDDAVRRVTTAAPEARIGVAHGQMSERELEKVMEAFSANEYDVLVATTIIESGIDNPHSNTLLIEDSQRLGLAQLYQLKGRVGRSHIKAYAYFLFPATQSLTEQAVERLVAIGDNTELGSGIKIAMRDLEIRGAGSLLGAEQSGQMSAVGFDLFAAMLTEAVSEARGEPISAYPDVRVDLPVSAFLPEEYVADVDARVLFYRRLAGSPTIEAIDAVAAELISAHGAMPQPARNLVDVARIRAMAAEAGATTVVIIRKRLTISPLTISDERRGQLQARGAVWLEREKKLAMPIEYGESVTHAALGMLDAILAAV